MKRYLFTGLALGVILVLVSAAAVHYGEGSTLTLSSEAAPLPVKPYGGLTFATSVTTGTAHAVSVAPAEDFVLEIVMVSHVTAASTGTLSITRDANAGSGYDTVLNSNDMADDVDYIYQPTRPIPCVSGDTIDIAWSPSTATTMSLTVVWGER